MSTQMTSRFLPRMRTAIAVLTLALLTGLVFIPGLGGDFVFDDFGNIVYNNRIHAETLTWEAVSRAAGAYQGPIGRPLATVSFAVDYALGGPSAFPFKLHNLLLHALNTCLVILLCKALLGSTGATTGRWPLWGILAVSLTWAIHPIQVSSVLYVVQRMEMQATFFTLAGLLLYVGARRRQTDGQRAWPRMALACGLPLLGLLSKENAILYPLYYFALELTFFRFEARDAKAAKRIRHAYAVVFAAGALAFAVLVLPRYASPEAFAIRTFGLEERLLTQLRILPMYIGQILLPSPALLPFYYDDIVPSTGLLSPPQTLAGGLFLIALLYSAWHFRHRAPVYALGIFWFFAAHAITSGPVNLELAFEHRNYFAALGILLAAASLLAKVGMGRARNAQVIPAFALVVVIGGLCMIRAATWGDPLVLAMDMVGRNPHSARASNDLAATYVRYSMGEPNSVFVDLALKEFARGAELPNSSPLAEQGLILTAAMSGRPADPVWWDSLLDKIRTQPIGPEQHMAVTGILKQHREGFRVDPNRLAEVYEALLERKSTPAPAMYAALADLVANDIGDTNRARSLYVKAVSASGKDPTFASRLFATLITDGQVEYAHAVADEMQRLGMTAPAPEQPPRTPSQ